MRVLHVAAAGLLLVALLAPAADAYAQPVFYFLKSGCPVDEVNGMCPVPDITLPPIPVLPPPVPPLPPVGVPKLVVADGILDPYDFLHPNAPNATDPDVKLVYTASETLVPVRFNTPEGHTHPDRLKGSFLVGLWTGESPVPNGNLTTTLYEIKPDGTSLAIANASVAIDLNVSKLPDPMSLVPPNSTDPMTILLYEVAQVVPLVLVPPLLFLLGPVDMPVDANSTFAMGFSLTQGSSQSPQPPGAVTLRFNSTLNPSFVYAPWYAPDPPRPTYTKPVNTFSRSSTLSRSTSRTINEADHDGKKGGNGIPGFEVSFAITMIAVAAFVARRRV